MWLVVSRIIFGAALIAPFLGEIGNMISPSPPTKAIKMKDERVINKYVDTLSFQLIDIDEIRGIASIEQARQSKEYVSFYFDEVTKVCANKEVVSDFIFCAHDVLLQYFSYKETVALSEGVVYQESDCDINSYLLYDVARINGYDVYVRYLPSHAVIVFNENGASYEFETTKTKNRLSSYALHNGSLSSFYNTWHSIAELINIYHAIVFLSVDDENRDYILHNDNLLSNPFGFDAYYYQKNTHKNITEIDVKNMNNYVSSGNVSNAILYVLSDWYFSQADTQSVRALLNRIEPCGLYCVETKYELGVISSIFPMELYRVYASIAVDFGIAPLFLTSWYFLLCLLFFAAWLTCEAVYYNTNRTRVNFVKTR